MVPYLRSTFWSCFCIPYSVFVFAPLFALLVTVIVRPHSYSVFRIRIRITDGSHILGAYPYYVSVFRICTVHCWAILWARLRIPYSVFVFRIYGFEPGCAFRILYSYSVFMALSQVAHSVLRIRIPY
jgi:hypothetical protein